MPDDFHATVGLTGPRDGNAANELQGVLDSSQADFLFQTLTNRPGVTVLSRPMVSQVEGTQASLFAGDEANSVQLTLLPRVAEGAKDVDLDVGIEMTSTVAGTNAPASEGK